jgi:hypothetical protein
MFLSSQEAQDLTLSTFKYQQAMSLHQRGCKNTYKFGEGTPMQA